MGFSFLLTHVNNKESYSLLDMRVRAKFVSLYTMLAKFNQK